MLIFGILVIIPGFVAGKATIDKSAGINLALWIGGSCWWWARSS